METNEQLKKVPSNIGKRMGVVVQRYKQFFAARKRFTKASQFESMSGDNLGRYWHTKGLTERTWNAAGRALGALFGFEA